MGHLLIQRLSGSQAIGHIGEGTGFGFQDIGRDLPGLMQFGSLATGRQEEEVGSGCPGTGNIVDRFVVKSPRFGDKILWAMNFQLITEESRYVWSGFAGNSCDLGDLPFPVWGKEAPSNR
jgi:hypothetical protein